MRETLTAQYPRNTAANKLCSWLPEIFDWAQTPQDGYYWNTVFDHLADIGHGIDTTPVPDYLGVWNQREVTASTFTQCMSFWIDLNSDAGPGHGYWNEVLRQLDRVINIETNHARMAAKLLAQAFPWDDFGDGVAWADVHDNLVKNANEGHTRPPRGVSVAYTDAAERVEVILNLIDVSMNYSATPQGSDYWMRVRRDLGSVRSKINQHEVMAARSSRLQRSGDEEDSAE